jgi:hypothetical protein
MSFQEDKHNDKEVSMINSISSTSSAMMMRSNSTQQHPPPPGKDAFKVADSDGDGLVSSTELESVVAGIAEITGTTLSAEDTLSNYDADQDGGLSGEEMLALLTDNGFVPPQGVGDETGGPPPPPSAAQALSSYSQNSGEELITQLIDILLSSENDSVSSSSLDLTA